MHKNIEKYMDYYRIVLNKQADKIKEIKKPAQKWENPIVLRGPLIIRSNVYYLIKLRKH